MSAKEKAKAVGQKRGEAEPKGTTTVVKFRERLFPTEKSISGYHPIIMTNEITTQNKIQVYINWGIVIVLIIGLVLGIVIGGFAVHQIKSSSCSSSFENETLAKGYNLGVNATFNYINSICRPIQNGDDTRFTYLECVVR